MAKIRAAIIGAGLIAGRRHVPAFLKQRKKVDLVAVCDVNQQAAQKLASTNGIAKSYGSISEMLVKERPDLVDICTPPQTHASVAVEAMAHGCHVLSEKPLAPTVADCNAIVEAAKKYGVKVCVAHNALFYLPFMRAKEIVARGEIGEFRGMQIYYSTPTYYMASQGNHWAHKLPGGMLGETGPHIVYLTQAFINPVRRVSIDATKLLEYPWTRFEDFRINLIGDKAISSATISYPTNQWEARLDLFGTDAILTLDLQGRFLVKRRRESLKVTTIGNSVLSEARQMLCSLVSNAARYVGGRFPTTHDVLVEKFIDSILKGSPPPVSAEDGRETVRVTKMIVDRLYEQHAQGAAA
jgi:predicted dehydrogenase